MDERKVEIELFCTDLPVAELDRHPDLRLGIQQRSSVVDDVPVADAIATGHVVFRFFLRVRGREGNGAPNFLGPHAQGTPATRFVYLCWGTREHDEWCPQRRAKVPLGPITWEQIDAAVATHQSLRATISCTDAKARPVAASLKPNVFSWSIVRGA